MQQHERLENGTLMNRTLDECTTTERVDLLLQKPDLIQKAKRLAAEPVNVRTNSRMAKVLE